MHKFKVGDRVRIRQWEDMKTVAHNFPEIVQMGDANQVRKEGCQL